MTLNESKCAIAVNEIQYLGHIVSHEGIKVTPDRVTAISEFPQPVDKKSLLQFLVTLNFVGKYIPHRTQLLEPLNSLLKVNSAFVWGPDQEKAFQKVKKLLETTPVLAHFDLSKKIIIQANASSYGLGAALLLESNKQTEVAAYASRPLTEGEKKFCQIEKEALCLAFGAERFRDYITGADVTLETDHKPLVSILQTKPLEDLSLRLQRIRIRLMKYSYKVDYIPGSQLFLADALSRNPAPCNVVDSDLESE